MSALHILPSVEDARITVVVIIDEISEAFDAGEMSRSLTKTNPTFFDRIFGYRESEDVRFDVKRCFMGIGKIRTRPSWEDPPDDWDALWPKDQKLLVALKHKNYVSLDKGLRPMLGYVEGLETKYRNSYDPVIVNLELPSYVADKLFQSVDDTITRPNTRPTLSMDWQFTNSYTTHDGKGGGAALWYPTSASFYRGTKRLIAEG